MSESEWDEDDQTESEEEEDCDIESETNCDSEAEPETEDGDEIVEERPPPARKRRNQAKLPVKAGVSPKPSQPPKRKRASETPVKFIQSSQSTQPSQPVDTVGGGRGGGRRKSANANKTHKEKSGISALGPNGGVLRGTKKRKVEKEGDKFLPPKHVMENSAICDMSNPPTKWCKNKFILGSNYNVQVGMICFPGSRTYSYEGIIFTREPKPARDGEEERETATKPFRFNMPTSCIMPLRNALTAILRRSGKESCDHVGTEAAAALAAEISG